MIINHNIAALNTYNRLAATNVATSKSLEKLSSGLRITRAGDDAAGLAISEKMRGQIRGLDQAVRNSQDGISMIQTAEGALNETHSILLRMRELAIQSASDTNTASDRQNLQDEMDQLTTEIKRISDTTEFNTKKLLNGEMGAAVNAAVANVNANSTVKSATGGGSAIGASTVLLTDLVDSSNNSLGITAGDTITVSWVKDGTTVNNVVTVAAATNLVSIDTQLTDAALSITAGVLGFTAGTAGFAGAVNGLTLTVKDSSGNIRTAATNALSAFSETTAAADVQTNGTAVLAIGANQNQTLNVTIANMGASALGVKGLTIKTQEQANTAIRVIDNAVSKVSTQRGGIGALQNRLEHTIANLGTSSENLSAAESRIRDVDMAKEMMSFTKNSIIAQAATSMLAQANQQPQGVLQLLK